MLLKSYTWIVNLARVDGEIPCELALGHVLAKATTDQTSKIMRLVHPFHRLSQFMFYFDREEPEQPAMIAHEAISECKVPVYVLLYEGDPDQLDDIQNAFNLSACELELGFGFIRDEHSTGFVWDMPKLLKMLGCTDECQRIRPKTLRQSDISDVKSLIEKLRAHDNDIIDLESALSEYEELKLLDTDSRLRFLGYFAILEMLLTHDPKRGNKDKPINKQIAQNIATVESQLGRPLDYKSFFGKRNSGDLWRALYRYRSKIAHGVKPDLELHRTIVTPARATMFMRNTVKEILRFTLENPAEVKRLKAG